MEKLGLLVFIDDDKATNYFHEIILEEASICLENKFFSSPALALEYFQSLQDQENPKVPDGIFLDINMPKMNGWEFLEEYSRLMLPRSPVIVMLTTSLRPEDQEKAEQNSFVNKIINKPLTAEKLIELFEIVLKPYQKNNDD